MDNINLVKFTKQWSEAERVIRLYLNSVIYNRADAQDILQRVALCAYRKYGDYDEKQPFQGWLFGIAKFEVLGYFRNFGRNPEVIDSEISERLADNMEDQSEAISREDDERREKLEQLLKQLPAKAQELIRLRFFEGKTQMEVAEMVGISQAQVSRLEKNALRVMRGYLTA